MKKLIISPDYVLKKIYNIDYKYKFTFCISMILFIITHAFHFMRRLANEDYLHYSQSHGSHVAIGRWLSDFITKYRTPWVSGIIAAILLSLSCVSLVYIFDVKRKYSIVIMSMLAVTFPTLAYGFGYLFMVEVYAIALFASIFAVALTKKYKNGWIIGSFFIMISLAYYQAYISVTMTICIVYLILQISLYKRTNKEFGNIVLKFLLMGLMGVVLYFIGTKLSLIITDTALSTYKGANQMGHIDLSQIGYLLKRTYGRFYLFFFGNTFFYNNKIISFMYAIGIITTVLLLCKYVKNINNYRKVLLVIFIFLIPFCANVVDFIAADSSSTNLNIYSFVIILMMPIVLIEQSDIAVTSFGNFKRWLVIISLFSLCINYFYITNVYYVKVNTYYEETELFYNRLYSRIEELEDFRPNMKIAVLGSKDSTKALFGEEDETFPIIINDQGLWGRFIGLNASGENYNKTTYKVSTLLKNIIGVKFQNASDEEIKKIVKSEEVKSMNLYPKEDSIKIIDDVIVVNMKDKLEVKEKVNNDKLVLELVNDESYSDISIAWYIYKDGKKEHVEKYSNKLTFEYQLSAPGEYYAVCYVNDKYGNSIRRVKSKSVTV